MTSREDALELFDSLEPVDIDFMIGRWRARDTQRATRTTGCSSHTTGTGNILNQVKTSTHCCFRTGEVKLSASTRVQWLVEANRVDRRRELPSGSFSS
jgi:hypothetical protein